jgi:hypothetical protein
MATGKDLRMAKRYGFFWPAMGLSSMAWQNTMLALEAQQVIALRMAKMAMGGAAAQREAQLMVTEKLAALAQGGQMMAMGAATGKKDLNSGKVTKMVRSKVRANRRRLTR